jgi:adenylate kinase
MKDTGVPIDCLLEIDVYFDTIMDYIGENCRYPASGRTDHIQFNPPK